MIETGLCSDSSTRKCFICLKFSIIFKRTSALEEHKFQMSHEKCDDSFTWARRRINVLPRLIPFRKLGNGTHSGTFPSTRHSDLKKSPTYTDHNGRSDGRPNAYRKRLHHMHKTTGTYPAMVEMVLPPRRDGKVLNHIDSMVSLPPKDSSILAYVYCYENTLGR